jgi:hypothetical protein
MSRQLYYYSSSIDWLQQRRRDPDALPQRITVQVVNLQGK